MSTARSAASPAGQQAANDPLARLLALKRTVVMGILNVTPDSFSDGGQFNEPARAIVHARRMADEGADILDIGAESSRPYVGMTPVSEDDELARLKPVLPAVVKLGLPVSIDTIKAKVAAWALEQGAAIANDVWGLQRDPDMARVVAEHRVPVVVMHNRDSADPAIDIVADVTAFFARSLDIAARAGIAKDRIVLDPGVGFGKTPVFNREGGSIPVVSTFQEVLGLPSVLFGIGLPDENAHAPDEKLDLSNFHGGVISAAYLYKEIGALKS